MRTGILIAVEFVQYIRYVHLFNELATLAPYFFSLSLPLVSTGIRFFGPFEIENVKRIALRELPACRK